VVAGSAAAAGGAFFVARARLDVAAGAVTSDGGTNSTGAAALGAGAANAGADVDPASVAGSGVFFAARLVAAAFLAGVFLAVVFFAAFLAAVLRGFTESSAESRGGVSVVFSVSSMCSHDLHSRPRARSRTATARRRWPA
jgi:hypothetical protein